MKRTLVISDIHGELDMFSRLLAHVNYNPKQDQLILLGDYVDRGPNSKELLNKVIELKKQGALVLKGNHEDMMIKALTNNDERTWRHWAHQNGGGKTLQSYGFKEVDYLVPEGDVFIKPILKSEVLSQHIQFIQSLDHIIEWEDTIFVHAGIHPQKNISDTDHYTLMWIREKFYNEYHGEKTVIFGHTATKNLHNDPSNHAVYFGKNRIIGIDGGAVYGGQLNCLELPSQAVYYVKSGEPYIENVILENEVKDHDK